MVDNPLIVHHYDKIDSEIIVGIVKKNLPDFEAFKAAARPRKSA
jgi:uncharacterized protein YutE (UPF0331/DUF86 family)